MSEILELRSANDLRVGDVIWMNGYPADLIDVSPLTCGAIVLIWGVGADDRVAVWAGATIGWLGRFDA